MAVEKEIQLISKLYLDGKVNSLTDDIIRFYGYVSGPSDILVPPDSTDYPIPLTNKAVIKAIFLDNKSCAECYYKLNGSSERYKLFNRAILCQAPTSILIDNDSKDTSAAIEVTIISENS